jgi:hypothetical protein
VTQSHRPARLTTRAASFRYGARHHSGIPGGIIPLYPGDFVGIRKLLLTVIFRVLASELLGSDIEDNMDHGIWIFGDELVRFRGAIKEIVELSSLGRSRGIRVVAAAQSFA